MSSNTEPHEKPACSSSSAPRPSSTRSRESLVGRPTAGGMKSPLSTPVPSPYKRRESSAAGMKSPLSTPGPSSSRRRESAFKHTAGGFKSPVLGSRHSPVASDSLEKCYSSGAPDVSESSSLLSASEIQANVNLITHRKPMGSQPVTKEDQKRAGSTTSRASSRSKQTPSKSDKTHFWNVVPSDSLTTISSDFEPELPSRDPGEVKIKDPVPGTRSSTSRTSRAPSRESTAGITWSRAITITSSITSAFRSMCSIVRGSLPWPSVGTNRDVTSTNLNRASCSGILKVQIPEPSTTSYFKARRSVHWDPGIQHESEEENYNRNVRLEASQKRARRYNREARRMELLYMGTALPDMEDGNETEEYMMPLESWSETEVDQQANARVSQQTAGTSSEVTCRPVAYIGGSGTGSEDVNTDIGNSISREAARNQLYFPAIDPRPRQCRDSLGVLMSNNQMSPGTSTESLNDISRSDQISDLSKCGH